MKIFRVLLMTGLLMAVKNISAQKVSPISPDSVLSIINNNPDSGTIVINFWATWCGPCVQEIPFFIQSDSMLKGENIAFIFVSFDPVSKLKSVQKFVNQQKMPGTQFLINTADFDPFITNADPSWAGDIPYTIVLTKDDRKNHSGSFRTFKELWNFIRE